MEKSLPVVIVISRISSVKRFIDFSNFLYTEIDTGRNSYDDLMLLLEHVHRIETLLYKNYIHTGTNVTDIHSRGI